MRRVGVVAHAPALAYAVGNKARVLAAAVVVAFVKLQAIGRAFVH